MAARDTLYGACQGAAGAEFLVDAMDDATYAEILAFSSHDAAFGEASQATHRAEHSYTVRCCARLCDGMGSCCLSCCCCRRMLWRLWLVDDGFLTYGDHEYSEAELKLRQDMAANKVVWYADYWKDYWCYTRNTNPILALCYSHPLHPISRKERVFITVLQTVFIMMVSSAIPKAQHCLRDGRTRYEATSWNGTNERFCNIAEHVGMTWSLENMSLGFGFGGSVYALVVNFIFAQILFQCGANCACCQFLRRDARRFSEFLGHLLMAVIFLMMLLPTWQFMQYNIYHHTLDSVMVTFLTSKPLSILLTTVVQSIIFSIIWLRETSAAPDKEDKGHAKFYVTATDYWAMVKRKSAAAQI
eukprot:TRINITY_DN1751_c1_g1_i2.p1 TRINITY_DN1751_c1_g1~~TRINITY_DN1751_c1_g1_i2.p1  ORF type:complete len:358 (+),score=56.28 TRINITY_DN1751_c1_g1_i2:53-1126(+)